MLRVAVPNKGGLAEPATRILREAGYSQRSDSRELVLVDAANQIEFYYLRPRDIAVYVGEGTLDAGITGRDQMLDSAVPAGGDQSGPRAPGEGSEEMLPLGFGRSTFRLAARPGTAASVSDLSGLRIATSYAGVMHRFLADRGISAQVTRLEGAVETAIQLGVADVIADVVETGTTLRRAGLELFGEPLLESEALLIRRQGRPPDPALEQMVRRLQGVLLARTYVLMDYDIREETLEQATTIAPGFEGATVSPLHREGWVAVRVMVPRVEAQRLMDELWELGARAILVTDIHACRL